MNLVDLLPWPIRAFWSPQKHLDLYDANGRPDHAKMLALYGFYANVGVVIAGLITGHWPPSYVMSYTNVSLYGWLGIRTLLKFRTATSTETATRTDTRTETIWNGDERGEHKERDYDA